MFPKLINLKKLSRKIANREPVRIGVFCSGNGDRSPLAQQVLKDEFKKRGLANVKVFSFGLSVSPSSHHASASERTASYARDLGYSGIDAHKRRHASDKDVQADVNGADLLLAVSPAHLGYLAEYYADEKPTKARDVLMKTWTLNGFANRREWTLPFDGFARAANRLYRGLSSKDPYFHPKTPAGEKAFRKDLDTVISDCKKAVVRLVGNHE
ncbi:hypothetical protein HY991_01750 [Candidatus Micrarchaeota archaeon]|nr:hypothetical protein [Candidatus Micrarchaeota archaeon]